MESGQHKSGKGIEVRVKAFLWRFQDPEVNNFNEIKMLLGTIRLRQSLV
jgi:hypothetical protein